MEELLYLDTARVGRPSPGTIRAATDALRLAAEEGGSAYFDRFLRRGLDDCPAWMRSAYPGLHSWQGVTALKADLRTLVCGPSDLPVLLANRTAQLMRLAARLLFARCRNVLACDLGWPAYHATLEDQAARTGRRVTTVPLREMVFGGRATAGEVAEAVAEAYRRQRCDGLFLPAVSNLGVRLPVERTVRLVESTSQVRFAVVDGAQEFCHATAGLASEFCDLYLTGCHKWLGGHHPMGVAFYGRRRTQGFVTTMLGELTRCGDIDDPLLRLVDKMEAGTADSYSETVNLAGLYTCQAAVSGACEQGPAAILPARLRAADQVARLAPDSGWAVAEVDRELRSAIVLLRAESPKVQSTEPDALRAAFRDRGVGLTVYDGGVVRLSMPTTLSFTPDAERLCEALGSF